MSEAKQLAVVPVNPIQLLSQAIEKGVDVEQMRALMDMEKEWRAEKAKAEYAAAMTKFGELKRNVQHNREGKTAGSATFSYADFPTLVSTVSPWLTECGLSFSHRDDPPMFNAEGKITAIMVYCRIRHNAGHYEEFHFPAVPDGRLEGKVSPSQLIQLAITYAKRQTLAMGLGVATSDDVHDDDSQKAHAITTEQANELQELMDKHIKNKTAFLEWLGVELLIDLPADKFERAKAECKKKAAA